MSYSIEQEIKFLLDREGFEQLLAYYQLAFTDYHTQQNTYYDTQSQHLKNENAALRLRNFSNKSEWTYKQKKDHHRSLELNDQYPYPILPAPSNLTLKEIQDPVIHDQLASIISPKEILSSFLTLKTDRWIIKVAQGEIALDRTYYSNTVDYEIECETDDIASAHQYLTSLMNELSINYQNADKKIARAIKYLSKK